MRFLYLLSVFILINCGDASELNERRLVITNGIVDTLLKPYVYRFELDYGKPIRLMTIVFGKLEYPTLGRCYYFEDGDDDRQIIINKDTWFNMKDITKELVMYHELGHCELNRYHHDNRLVEWSPNADTESLKVPISLMNEFISFHHYSTLREYYIKELFNRNPEPFWE